MLYCGSDDYSIFSIYHDILLIYVTEICDCITIRFRFRFRIVS